MRKTRREFLREKRRQIKRARKVLGQLHCGCAVPELFDGTDDFWTAVYKMEDAVNEMDRITKPLA